MVGRTYQQVKRRREKRKKKGDVNKTKGKKERRKGGGEDKTERGGSWGDKRKYYVGTEPSALVYTVNPQT